MSDSGLVRPRMYDCTTVMREGLKIMGDYDMQQRLIDQADIGDGVGIARILAGLPACSQEQQLQNLVDNQFGDASRALTDRYGLSYRLLLSADMNADGSRKDTLYKQFVDRNSNLRMLPMLTIAVDNSCK